MASFKSLLSLIELKTIETPYFKGVIVSDKKFNLTFKILFQKIMIIRCFSVQ